MSAGDVRAHSLTTMLNSGPLDWSLRAARAWRSLCSRLGKSYHSARAHIWQSHGLQWRSVCGILALASRRTETHLRFSIGVVLCSPLLRSYLINYARTLIYSTAMPHLNVIAVQKSFEMLELGHGDAVGARMMQWQPLQFR